MSRHSGRIVDLSHPLASGMPVYPDDPDVRVFPAATIAVEGVNVQHLQLSSQCGTHLDAPYHFFADGAQVEDLDLCTLVGPAVVADLRRCEARTPVRWDDVASAVEARRRQESILILHTGWSRHWATSTYADHPFLDADTATRIVESGIRTIAIDALSIDESTGTACEFEAHRRVLGAGAVIVENLTNLSDLPVEDTMVSFLPLRIRAADGAPIRAVGWSAQAGACFSKNE